MQVGLRDFDVVAEDRVELHLQRSDPGALALALLDLRQILLAVAAQVAQFVEFVVDAAAESRRRRSDEIGGSGTMVVSMRCAQIGEFID